MVTKIVLFECTNTNKKKHCEWQQEREITDC
jgi:hypothetical protein